MQITCHCGQPFEITTEQFPRRVSCHVCGQHFTTLDNGETFDLQEDLSAPVEIRDTASTAIQKEPAPRQPVVDATAVCTDETLAHLPAIQKRQHGPTSEQQIRLIDLQWNQERMGFALFNMFGVVIFPSRPLAAWICVCWLGVYAGGVGLLAFIDVPLIHAVWEVGIIVVFGCVLTAGPVLTFAAKFEESEAEWQQKRIRTFAKNGGNST